MEEGEAEPGEMLPSLKRPNPITWQTPPKKARLAPDAAGDDSPADSADVRQPGSVSASRVNSSRPTLPSPAKGTASRRHFYFEPGYAKEGKS